MRSRTSWVLMGLLGVAALVVAGIGLRDQGAAVETAAVTRGVLEVTVDEEGRTRVRDRYVVAAPVSGRLARMTVKEGDHVSEGDLLARVYSTPEDPREVATRRGQLAAAEARQSEAATLVETARAEEPGRPAPRRPAPVALTERQLRILGLMAKGLTNAQISKRVGFSESTVRQETMAIYRYFGVSGRREAVRLAGMRGMLDANVG